MPTQTHTRSRNPGAPRSCRPLVGAGHRWNSPSAAFVLLTLTILTAASAAAQPAPTLLWSAHGVENVVSLTSIRDIDGDGGPDVVFESYDAGPSGVNHLFAIRGRSSGTGDVLWSARPLGGPSNSGGYGDNCLRVGPDLSGDGFPEILFGAAWGSRTAFALHGQSGSTFWKFDTYSQSPPTPPISGWVYAMESLGSDLTGDGVPEVVFCCGSENNGIYCVNGRTGAVIWFYMGADAFGDIRSISDIDHDGIRDVIVGGMDNAPGVYALSGAGNGFGGGRLLWSRTTGTVWSLALLEDITGDGISEVVAATWDNLIQCFNGATGVPVWSRTADYGERVAVLDDVNQDGIQDIAYGSWDNAARVYSGANGNLIWRTPVGTLNGGDVWAIDRVDDITGDGINDVCCGSFDECVYLMDGVTGQIQWRYPTGNRVLTVRGAPDLDGNGVPDVIAGTQMPSDGTGGICYALQGGGPLAAVRRVGASAMAVSLTPGSPNPFAATTAWDLQVMRSGLVDLSIFGPAGQRITDLLQVRATAPGRYSISWNGRDSAGRRVPAGVYYARLAHDGKVAAQQRAVLIR